jgi:hypothetical protein
MQIVPPHYATRSEQYAIIDAIGAGLQSWFADTVTEPAPEQLAALVRRMEMEQPANDLTAPPTQQRAAVKPQTPQSSLK